MTIQSNVEYLAQRSARPVYTASSAGRNASHEIDQPTKFVTIEVDDARDRDREDDLRDSGLHPSGFDLYRHHSEVTDFLDEEQIKAVYELEITSLLKSITGCSRVHLFDHTVRASDAQLRETKNIREPAFLVHNDYTRGSGIVCLRESLGEEAERLLQTRFQIINVWRPLVDPVQDYPLALCDARSIRQADLVDTERRAPNHTGEIQLAVHDAAHHWFYFPAMRPDEVLLFKTFDSANGGNNPCSIHSAIRLAHAPADAKPRESIETRAFVFYQ